MGQELTTKNAVARVHVLLLATLAVLWLPVAASAQCGGRWLTSPASAPPELDDAAWSLAVLPNGDLVAGGQFTTAGGVAANRIARWDGSSWSSLGSGLNGTVFGLAVLPSGDLVAGGTFTTAGGAAARYVARWDGSSWSPLGSGMNGDVYALAVLPNGDLVAGGFFTTAGGVAVNRVARWNGTSWSPLGSGMDGEVYAPVSYTHLTLPTKA